MCYIYFTESASHSKSGHLENFRRVHIAKNEIRKLFDYTHFPLIHILNFEDFTKMLYSNDILYRFNRPQFVFCKTCNNKHSKIICEKCGDLNCFWYIDPDTYCTNETLNCIIELVSNLKAAIDSISIVKYHYLLVRPPGHHCFNKSSGFCIINNVFLMAKYAKSRNISRIFILDWDFHHGDGTAKLVDGEEGMFFVSIHAYGDLIFPGTGSVEENTNNVRNFPIILDNYYDRKRHNDNEYMSLMNNEIHDLIVDFNPELILISNGLDAHENDQLEGLGLTNQFYIDATKKLISYNVPLIFVLEGGYNPDVIKNVSIDMLLELTK